MANNLEGWGMTKDEQGPDEGHTFEITWRSRGAYRDPEGVHRDVNYWGDPMTLSVRAWSLRDALEKVAALPLTAWPWPEDDFELELPSIPPSECPNGPHRGPEGPNEDLSQCPRCWSVSWELRPEGQTYGHHLPDCSLPLRHESYCQPGGSGHPPAGTIRGYFGPEGWHG